MNSLLRGLFFLAVVRPVMLVVLGLNVRYRQRLPQNGPAVVVANHNSHLDTMVLITLFPAALLPKVRPVAAADYFLRNRLLSWFSRNILGIIPLVRTMRGGADPFTECYRALDEGSILIVFPEGSRGEPEKISTFKRGIALLAERYPETPVYPVFLHGLGKALPKGEALLVPFFCDVFVGEPMLWKDNSATYMAELESRFRALAVEGQFAPWE